MLRLTHFSHLVTLVWSPPEGEPDDGGFLLLAVRADADDRHRLDLVARNRRREWRPRRARRRFLQATAAAAAALVSSSSSVWFFSFPGRIIILACLCARDAPQAMHGVEQARRRRRRRRGDIRERIWVGIRDVKKLLSCLKKLWNYTELLDIFDSVWRKTFYLHWRWRSRCRDRRLRSRPSRGCWRSRTTLLHRSLVRPKKKFQRFEKFHNQEDFKKVSENLYAIVLPLPASIWLCCHCSCVRWSVTLDTGASTWTTSWRAKQFAAATSPPAPPPPPERAMGASAIAADTFRRNFLAATDSFLDLRRRLVVDTQEPMVTSPHLTWINQPRIQVFTPSICRVSEKLTVLSSTQRTKKIELLKITTPINQSTNQMSSNNLSLSLG